MNKFYGLFGGRSWGGGGLRTLNKIAEDGQWNIVAESVDFCAYRTRMPISENIRMCSCVQHQEDKFVVILFPDQKPIWLKMTLPSAIPLTANQFVRLVFWWQRTINTQNVNSL